MKPTNPSTVLIVDDHPYSRLTVVDMLRLNNYEVLESDGSGDVWAEVNALQPDVVLLDVMMPNNDGLALCHRLKREPQTESIPVLLMTALEQDSTRLKSREIGADGYLLKPLDRIELLTRIDLLIQKKTLTDSINQIEQVLFRVAQAIESRYSVGHALVSSSELLEAFGIFLNLTPTDRQDLVFAARLHDLGTVVIPDAVMLKQGALSPAELELVEQHVLVGEKIFEPLATRRDVGQIMRHHHERWDGSGYPDRLKGEQIPYLAQIFQIIDVFRALTRDRSYKAAVSLEEALAILAQEVERGWRNPELVQQFSDFIRRSPQFLVKADGQR